MKNLILVTGGQGRFAKVLKKNNKFLRLYFATKRECNILNIKSLEKIQEDQFKLAHFFWHYQNSEKKINIDWKSLSEKSKVALLTSTRWQEDLDTNLISKALKDPSKKVQIAVIRIIADRDIKKYKEDLKSILTKIDDESQLSKVTASALKKL